MLNKERILEIAEELGKFPVWSIDNLEELKGILKAEGYATYLDQSTDYLIAEKEGIEEQEENNYQVSLINNEGCNFDNASFTDLTAAKEWAAGRGKGYKIVITVNYDAELNIAEEVIEYNL